jgi:hypothetical protein
MGSLRGPEIRLLDALKRPLERRQTPLVVGKVQLGVFGDLRKPQTVRDSEIPRVYCLRHILPTFAYQPQCLGGDRTPPKVEKNSGPWERIDLRAAIGCPVGSNLTALCSE